MSLPEKPYDNRHVKHHALCHTSSDLMSKQMSLFMTTVMSNLISTFMANLMSACMETFISNLTSKLMSNLHAKPPNKSAKINGRRPWDDLLVHKQFVGAAIENLLATKKTGALRSSTIFRTFAGQAVTNRQPIGDQSPISRHPSVDQSATNRPPVHYQFLVFWLQSGHKVVPGYKVTDA